MKRAGARSDFPFAYAPGTSTTRRGTVDQPQLNWIANYIWGIADDNPHPTRRSL